MLLKGIKTVNDSLQSDQLEANLMGYFGYGLLEAGGFFNVTVPTSGVYGGNESVLRPVNDPYFPQGQVWEGFRKDWVWETGIPFASQPIRVSGVYVDGHFLPLSSGVRVDYPNGRVTLPSSVSPVSGVTCEYSYRLYQFYTADSQWWEQVQMQSFRVDDSQFLQAGSGAWDVLAENRIQLPAVIIEAVPRTDRRPFELGSTGQIVRQDVLFHVLAEDRYRFTWMHDCLTAQQEQRIQGFDKNVAAANDVFPLDYGGFPKGSGLMYTDLVKPTGQGGCQWVQIRCTKTTSQDQKRLGTLRYCTVRGTFEMDLP